MSSSLEYKRSSNIGGLESFLASFTANPRATACRPDPELLQLDPNGTVLRNKSDSEKVRKAVLLGGSGTRAHYLVPMTPLLNPAA